MKHMNKAIIATTIAAALFSGTALAASGNPETLMLLLKTGSWMNCASL